MTDEHGPDSQPVHEESTDQEHAATDAGVWSDDHPPVDDFADSAVATEDVASLSHETGTETDETEISAAAPARSMLPLFAGIGGILLLGAVIYWQFGHSSPPPMMAMPAAAPKSSSSLAANHKPSEPVMPAPKKVEQSDITSLYRPSDSAPPVASDQAPAEPTTAMAPAPEPTAPPASVPAAATSASASVTDSRIDALTTRMDALQKSVEAATKQLNQLGNMVAATQAMPPASGQASPVLMEDRLNKIEQSLMQIEHNQAVKAPPVSMPAKAEASSEVLSDVTAKPTPHRTASSTKHAATIAKTKTAHHKTQTIPMVTMKSSSWVLRAATPNEAWVSADAHTAELRHVQIGDNLSGVGQIRTIRQTPSGWEIEGTTGTIR